MNCQWELERGVFCIMQGVNGVIILFCLGATRAVAKKQAGDCGREQAMFCISVIIKTWVTNEH